MVFSYWTISIALIDWAMATAATLHAVLYKRETRTVIGWVGLVWLSPFLGPILYLIFGINRIERKGHKIRQEITLTQRPATLGSELAHDRIAATVSVDYRLAKVGKVLTGAELLPGNSVEPLVGGKAAYAAMLSAIESAEKTIALSTYIFDYDKAGRKFIDALVAAQQRGVEVRVLIDHIGSRYSRPSSVRVLKRLGINAAGFLPTYIPVLATYANLRNHRKILVVDGTTGFTGGMNIREGCLNEPGYPHPVQDLHFRLVGPVVEHLLDTFQADWRFVTGEQLPAELWYGDPEVSGQIWARGLPDGPDEDFDHMRLVMLAAIIAAQHRVDIMTPYFLPDSSLVGALNVVAMKGVPVRIIVPDSVNIKPVQWASMEPLERVLERGCRVYQSPPPFDHTKLLLIDDEWSLLGSSNWDPRSLRLNFEFNVECYGRNLNEELSQIVESTVQKSRPLTLDELHARPLPIRIRDGFARLATPYL